MKDWYYFKLVDLPENIKKAHKIRGVERLDCVEAYYPDNEMRGLTFFVNHKGQLFFSKTKPKFFSKADNRRQANIALTKSINGNSYNLSSIYIDAPEHSQYGHGNPPHAKLLGLKKNKPNPLYAFRNDLYLFISNQNSSVVELIIIPDEKNLWNSYYWRLINGDYDKALQALGI